MTGRSRVVSVLVVWLLLACTTTTAAAEQTATPKQLVDAYDSLADTILGAKQTEWNLVHSILAMTYAHAEGAMAVARRNLEAGESAGAAIEDVATYVAQLGNEGDAAVAAVRKRLLEGGHHHNAAGEAKGIYDEGFVIVTREAKKSLLESSKAIGKLAGSKDLAALTAIVTKMAESQTQMLQNQAAICQSTNSDCHR